MRLSLFIALLAALLPSGRAFGLIWNSNEVMYSYGTTYREPGNAKNGKGNGIEKSIVSLTHSDGWTLGTNFINIDILFSSPPDIKIFGRSGAVEIYIVDRQDFSLSKITGTALAFGPVKDVTLQVGADWNSKNDAFGSEKRMPTAGIGLMMDVPFFWKIAILWDKEFNRNRIVGRDVTFESTWRVESAWDAPFILVGQSFSFEGFASINGQKGADGFGRKTVTEVLINSRIMWDLGEYAGHKGLLKIGGGWEYWLNKFGNDRTLVPGSLASTPFVRAGIHFAF